MVTSKGNVKLFEDVKVNTKIVLSGLWIALMLLYLYCDIFSLFKPGSIARMSSGFMGPFQVTQISLFTASLLMIAPAILVILSLILKANPNRWMNIIAGAVYTLVGISNAIGENWMYYLVFVVIEIMITVVIVVVSIRWPVSAGD